MTESIDVSAGGRTLREILVDIDAYAEENNDFLLAQYVGELIAVTDVLVHDYKNMISRVLEMNETMEKMEGESAAHISALQVYENYHLRRVLAGGPSIMDLLPEEDAKRLEGYYDWLSVE